MCACPAPAVGSSKRKSFLPSLPLMHSMRKIESCTAHFLEKRKRLHISSTCFSGYVSSSLCNATHQPGEEPHVTAGLAFGEREEVKHYYHQSAPDGLLAYRRRISQASRTKFWSQSQSLFKDTKGFNNQNQAFQEGHKAPNEVLFQMPVLIAKGW